MQINNNYHSLLFITELEGYKVSVWDISVWDLSVNATHPVYLYRTEIRPRMYQIKPNIVREGVSALCGTRDKLSRVYK